MVVSKISACRLNAVSALGITKGARDIDSTPPAMITSASPALIARAAVATASSPERAEPIYRNSGHVDRQTGQQRGHARDVAVVFAGLVGATQDDFIQRGWVDGGIAFQHSRDRECGQVIGTDGCEGTTVSTYGGADGVADESL